MGPPYIRPCFTVQWIQFSKLGHNRHMIQSLPPSNESYDDIPQSRLRFLCVAVTPDVGHVSVLLIFLVKDLD